MDETFLQDSDATLAPKRRKIFGMEFAPRNIPFRRRMETFAVALYVFVFLFLGIFSVPVLGYIFLYTSYRWYVVLYLAWYLFDRKTPEKGGRQFESVRGWFLWHYLRDFFPIKLVKTADLDPKNNYVFGYHPHGIMAFGGSACFMTEVMGFSRKFPGIKPHFTGLGGWFRLPFTRELLLFLGACSVSAKSIQHVLTKCGPGASVLIPVGGAAEVIEARPGQVVLKLKNRKGFIRRAMIGGAHLVPVFAFGENEVYGQVANPEGSFLRLLQVTLKKILGFYPPLMYGRGIFQYTVGIIPFRKPINVVVGSAIEVIRYPNPGDSDVDEAHALYLKELKELFDSHKGKYGMEDIELIYS